MLTGRGVQYAHTHISDSATTWTGQVKVGPQFVTPAEILFEGVWPPVSVATDRPTEVGPVIRSRAVKGRTSRAILGPGRQTDGVSEIWVQIDFLQLFVVVSVRFDVTRIQKIPEVSPVTHAALAIGDSVPLALMLEAKGVLVDHPREVAPLLSRGQLYLDTVKSPLQCSQ